MTDSEQALPSRPKLDLRFPHGTAANEAEAMAELWKVNPDAAHAHQMLVLAWERSHYKRALERIGDNPHYLDDTTYCGMANDALEEARA